MNATAASDLSLIAGRAIVWQGDSLPPAALATRPAQSVSDRYQFISTKQVIDMMADEGFVVASTAVRRVRKSNPLGNPATRGHLVDFRHPDAPTLLGVVPRILFQNSHDGSRAAQVRIGAFRFVCSNGMVTGLTLSQANVRHAGAAARELVDRMRQLSKNTLPMFQQIERWSRTRLSAARAHDFARLAMQARWGRPDVVPTDALLDVRRDADAGDDLWSVFNRVQEATTRTALAARTATGRRLTTRPLLELGPNLKYNAALWRLAEEFEGFAA